MTAPAEGGMALIDSLRNFTAVRRTGRVGRPTPARCRQDLAQDMEISRKTPGGEPPPGYPVFRQLRISATGRISMKTMS
jgi:hypothetical protein